MDKLDAWDFPDTHQIPSGYDMESVPSFTPDNFLKLIEVVNEFIDRINELEERI